MQPARDRHRRWPDGTRQHEIGAGSQEPVVHIEVICVGTTVHGRFKGDFSRRAAPAGTCAKRQTHLRTFHSVKTCEAGCQLEVPGDICVSKVHLVTSGDAPGACADNGKRTARIGLRTGRGAANINSRPACWKRGVTGYDKE